MTSGHQPRHWVLVFMALLSTAREDRVHGSPFQPTPAQCLLRVHMRPLGASDEQPRAAEETDPTLKPGDHVSAQMGTDQGLTTGGRKHSCGQPWKYKAGSKDDTRFPERRRFRAGSQERGRGFKTCSDSEL